MTEEPKGTRVFVTLNARAGGSRVGVWTRTIERGEQAGWYEVWISKLKGGAWTWVKRIVHPSQAREMSHGK